MWLTRALESYCVAKRKPPISHWQRSCVFAPQHPLRTHRGALAAPPLGLTSPAEQLQEQQVQALHSLRARSHTCLCDMTLNTLKAVTGKGFQPRYEVETKSGIYRYDGQAGTYHEWEFRTRARYYGTKDDDKQGLGCRIIEGLSGEAYLVAKNLGIETLSEKEGVPKLIDAMRKRIFPI